MGGLRTGRPGASLDPHPVTATAAALSLSPVAVNQHWVIAAHVLPQPGTLRVLPQKGAAEMAGSAEGAGFPSTFQLVWKLPRDGGLRMGGSANDCLRSFVGADGSGRSHTTASGSSTHATQRRKSVRRRPPPFGGSWLIAAGCNVRSWARNIPPSGVAACPSAAVAERRDHLQQLPQALDGETWLFSDTHRR